MKNYKKKNTCVSCHDKSNVGMVLLSVLKVNRIIIIPNSISSFFFLAFFYFAPCQKKDDEKEKKNLYLYTCIANKSKRSH